jgi:hypothetical protein
MKAKCLLIDDYMIAEQATEITLERIFKACGKHIPDGVSMGTPNKSPYSASVASNTSSSNKTVQQNSLANKDELEKKVLALTEGMKKYERISKEPLNETQKFNYDETSQCTRTSPKNCERRRKLFCFRKSGCTII